MSDKILTLVLGSNLGDRSQNLENALQLLDNQLNTPCFRSSSVLPTKAVVFEGPEFLNLIAQYKTNLDPFLVLKICKQIEHALGRTDSPEYDSEGRRVYHDRTIDIDILSYGGLRLDTPELTLPHPQIFERAYIEDLLATMLPVINPEIRKYVEDDILPRYDSFDKAHRRSHVGTVISQALRLSLFYDVDPDMIYVAAAYHDTGLCVDRKAHHLESSRIIRSDTALTKWFSQEHINIIADAAEDHRASSEHEPRTDYGRIIAEADRQIDPYTIIERTVQFGMSHYPELPKEGHWQRMNSHLLEKYAEGGYLKLWIPESQNVVRLETLRSLIRDERHLREIFEEAYASEMN